MSREELYRQHYYLGRNVVSTNDGWLSDIDRIYEEYYLLCSLPSAVEDGAGVYEEDNEDDPKVKSAIEFRPQLLRQIATEVVVRQALDGEVVLQSDLQWVGAGLPHSAVLTLLRSFGICETWLAFFGNTGRHLCGSAMHRMQKCGFRNADCRWRMPPRKSSARLCCSH